MRFTEVLLVNACAFNSVFAVAIEDVAKPPPPPPKPTTKHVTSTLVKTTTSAVQTTSAGVLPIWAQCGGEAWTRLTACTPPQVCVYVNFAYSQCQPPKASTTSVSTTALRTPIWPVPTTTTTAASTATSVTYVRQWGQCGGEAWGDRPTSCESSWVCVYMNFAYSQCQPPASTTTTTPYPTSSIPPIITTAALVKLWGQCGGTGWIGGTQCEPPATCVYHNSIYAQCLLPATSTTSAAAPTTSIKVTTTLVRVTTTKGRTTSSTKSSKTTTTKTTKPSKTKTSVPASPTPKVVDLPPNQQWQQCGGFAWWGSEACVEPYVCKYYNVDFSGCVAEDYDPWNPN